jgi:hypothetical protein
MRIKPAFSVSMPTFGLGTSVTKELLLKANVAVQGFFTIKYAQA